MARPPLGPDLVHTVDAGAQARLRAEAILETIAGAPIAPACERLGIGEARFHVLRRDFLAGGLAALEPKPQGRPQKVSAPETERVRELEARVVELEAELRASQVREELAVALPTRRTPKKTVLEKARRARRRRRS